MKNIIVYRKISDITCTMSRLKNLKILIIKNASVNTNIPNSLNVAEITCIVVALVMNDLSMITIKTNNIIVWTAKTIPRFQGTLTSTAPKHEKTRNKFCNML
jgi:hypothetical protein